MDSIFYDLVATFGMSLATAGSIATLLIAAYKAGTLTLSRAAALIAGTGVVGIAVALVALISYPFLEKKIKAGKDALQAW